jgi:hypothetical protein
MVSRGSVSKLSVFAPAAEGSFAESVDSRTSIACGYCGYCGEPLEPSTSWHAKRDLLFCSEACKEIRCGSVSLSGSELPGSLRPEIFFGSEVRRDRRSWLGLVD